MKTRNGFVSNSSTSSFIVMGYEKTAAFDKIVLASDVCPKTDIDGTELTDDERLELFYEGCAGSDDPFRVVTGDEMSHEVVGLDLGEATASEVADIANSIKKLLKTDVEPKIYSGSYYS